MHLLSSTQVLGGELFIYSAPGELLRPGSWLLSEYFKQMVTLTIKLFSRNAGDTRDDKHGNARDMCDHKHGNATTYMIISMGKRCKLL